MPHLLCQIHSSFYSLAPPIMALKMHKMPRRTEMGIWTMKGKRAEHQSQAGDCSVWHWPHSGSELPGTQGEKDDSGMLHKRHLQAEGTDQELQRVTPSGSQRSLYGALQEGVLRKAVSSGHKLPQYAAPHPGYVARHLPSENNVTPSLCSEKHTSLLRSSSLCRCMVSYQWVPAFPRC